MMKLPRNRFAFKKLIFFYVRRRSRPFVPQTSTGLSYFEQTVPLVVNVTKEITNTPTDLEFIPGNTRGATGILFSDTAKVKKVFLIIVGLATNAYLLANALDCTTPTHNRWKANIDGGDYFLLRNDDYPDGQMHDNDWRCPVEGASHAFPLMFEVTSQMTAITAKIGLKLENARAESSSIYLTIDAFLKIMYYA
jgi:hypothetical protein